MQYENCTLVDAHSEEGIIFISLKHNASGVVGHTFLSPDIKNGVHFFNYDSMVEQIDKYVEEHENGKDIMKDTIFLQIQRDLMKIYKEFV